MVISTPPLPASPNYIALKNVEVYKPKNITAVIKYLMPSFFISNLSFITFRVGKRARTTIQSLMNAIESASP